MAFYAKLSKLLPFNSLRYKPKSPKLKTQNSKLKTQNCRASATLSASKKIHQTFSQLNKKAILMALPALRSFSETGWTKASLCDKTCFESSACRKHQAD